MNKSYLPLSSLTYPLKIAPYRLLVLTRPFPHKVIYGDCSVVLTFESVDEIVWYEHSNETSLHGTICFSIFYIMKFWIFLEFVCLPLEQERPMNGSFRWNHCYPLTGAVGVTKTGISYCFGVTKTGISY